MKRIELAAHLTSNELKARYRSCHDANQARRCHILWQLSLGATITETAALTHLHRTGFRKIVQRYNADRPDAVPDQRRLRPRCMPMALSTQRADRTAG